MGSGGKIPKIAVTDIQRSMAPTHLKEAEQRENELRWKSCDSQQLDALEQKGTKKQ